MSDAFTFTAQVHAAKRAIIARALRAHRGNRTQTARALHLERSGLVRLIRLYGLQQVGVRPGSMRARLIEGTTAAAQERRIA